MRAVRLCLYAFLFWCPAPLALLIGQSKTSHTFISEQSTPAIQATIPLELPTKDKFSSILYANRLAGYVYCSRKNDPCSAAKVSILDPKSGTVLVEAFTSHKGWFSIDNPPAQSSPYHMVISCGNNIPARMLISLKPSSHLINVKLDGLRDEASGRCGAK